MTNLFTHMMIRVADLDRAARFYEGALGFVSTRGARVEGIQDMVGAPHEYVDIRFLAHESGLTIELVHAPATPAVAPPSEQLLGFTGPGHFAWRVSDIEAVLSAVRTHGGEVVEESRTTRPNGAEVIFVRDPDGSKHELVQPAA